MRLWHQELIPFLPRQQLLGQHRECCALRGKGWGKKHSTVDYVFTHSYLYLFQYHMLVMQEMERRGYKPDQIWKKSTYRGKILKIADPEWYEEMLNSFVEKEGNIYDEHNSTYLQECLTNLANKDIIIKMSN